MIFGKLFGRSDGESTKTARVRQISAPELKSLLASNGLQLIDVREPHEHRLCRIDGALHVPMMQLLLGTAPDLDPNKTTVCYCHHGSRSQRCAEHLASRGFTDVRNLRGGIHAWAIEVDPQTPRY